ncbi:hypothetical protein CU098_011354, partial [Rhizopus stolonifer]
NGVEKIKQIGNSLSCVHEFMDVDAPEEIKDEDSFGDAFLFAEKYIVEQIEKLFDLIIREGFTTKDAALVTGINIRTAQNYVKTYNNDPQKRLPGSYNKPHRRPCSKLTEEHSKCLVDYVKKNTTAVLDELKLKLCEKFEGLKISIFAIHKRLVRKHIITLKNLKRYQQREIPIE